MVNADDYAVLIGIGRYAAASAKRPWLPDLKGPDNDVAAVYAWLTNPDGGGLPATNVLTLHSGQFPNPFAATPEPDAPGVEGELRALTALPDDQLEERYAGRRLYVYIAGHGISTGAEEAALITAEATKGDVSNVLVTSWVKWLTEAARFQEQVLWVDCCATVPRNTPVNACGLPQQLRGILPYPRRFYAFAAPVGEKAGEAEMADGNWHGAFTYALLQGLEGAAADHTGEALRNYLHNNMKVFMDPKQTAVRGIAKEPLFGPTDPIAFGPPRRRAKFEVTLKFPDDCVGQLATVSFDSSGLAAATVLTGPEWTVSLNAGFYVAYVESTGHQEVFAVSGEQ